MKPARIRRDYNIVFYKWTENILSNSHKEKSYTDSEFIIGKTILTRVKQCQQGAIISRSTSIARHVQ